MSNISRPPFDRYSIIWTILNLTSLLQIGSRGDYGLKAPSTSTSEAPSTNYLGASIFISYIIAALVLTFAISSHLETGYRRIKARGQGSPSQWRQFKTFSTLASLSFAVLSWNMLNFLIMSYQAWSMRWVPSRSTTSPDALSLVKRIWQWTIQSTLFLDFARSLCANQYGYWWVMQALMATMTSVYVMQIAGRQWKIRNMLYYFAIGQILPISFAMNLFSIALVLAQIENETTTEEAKQNEGLSMREQTFNKADKEVDGQGLWVVGATMIVYRLNLFQLPSTVNRSDFMNFVLTTRLMLFGASGIKVPAPRALDKRLARSHLSVLRVYTVCQIIAAFIEQNGFQNLVNQAWHLVESPAVSALSMDYLLWFVSIWVLNSSGLLGRPVSGDAAAAAQDSIW